MTTNSRMAKIADKIPPKVEVNRFIGMSDAELLVTLKDLVEHGGEPENDEQAKFIMQAKNILTNHNIAWQVSE
jgi:hypothetical protein